MMEYVISYLQLLPSYVWQIVALLLPGNKLFRFIAEKLGGSYIPPPTATA